MARPIVSPVQSPGAETRVLGDLAQQRAAQQPGLHLQDAAVADAVAEDRMRDQRVHASLEGGDDRPAAGVGQGHRAGPADEARRRHLAVVDQRQHDRIGDQRPELLGQVERQRRPPVARPVVEAEHRIEARPHAARPSAP